MIEDDWKTTEGVFPGADKALDLELYGNLGGLKS